MKKQVISVTLAAALLVGASFPITASAASTTQANNATATTQANATATSTWFKDQLSGKALALYNALDTLRANGGLMTGTASVDLVAGGYLTQQDIKAYIDGDTALAYAFQQARDAFMYDNANLFYVNYEKLTFRLGTNNTGYAAEIGKGSHDNYYTDGFASQSDVDAAIVKTEQKIASIASAASGSDADKVKAVHDAIIKLADYKTGASYVTSAYGALTQGTANCEGYARSMKAILDRLSIPSVLVSGTAINSQGEKEAHMWNYVQVGGQWFAVDATWDDPIGGSPRDLYLMNGANQIAENHMADGSVSPNGMVFAYPELSGQSYNELTKKDSGLVIKTDDMTDRDGDAYTLYSYSYNGMGISQLEKLSKPIYFTARFSYDGKTWGEWVDLSAYAGSYSNNIAFYMGFVQFAVTTMPMDGRLSYKTDLSKDGMNLAISEKYEVTNSTPTAYNPAPYVLRSTPSVTSAIRPGTKRYTITYDHNLKKTGDVSVTATADQDYLNYSISNVTYQNSTETYTFDDETKTREICTVSFDFTTDDTYNTHNATYTFHVNGLVSTKNDKVPNDFRYLSKLDVVGCRLSYDFFVGASPRQLADDAIANYTGIDRSADLNILLVANKDGKSSTYALNTDCNYVADFANAASHTIVGVPYPKGHNPDHDGNVTFTAYCMVKQSDGTYAAKEAICSITEKGLQIDYYR